MGRSFPGTEFIACDLTRDIDPAVWRSRLLRIDAVVNVAGVLTGPSMRAVHVTAPQALYQACIEVGVRRVILLSAISARPDVETDYARTKLEGERALMGSGLDWTVLRPSLVYAKGSYGGTSLLRGLAGLPGVLLFPGDGSYAFTPIHVNDLAHAIRVVCVTGAFSGQVLEPVGPETLSLRILLERYRRWLGFGSARPLAIPLSIMSVMAKLGDWFKLGPVSTNSLRQLLEGNAGDSRRFAEMVGFKPRSFADALESEPADVQDRWHARLFFLAPVLRAVLVLLWVASGTLGLFYGRSSTFAVLAVLGLPASLVVPLQIGSSLLDFGIAGLLISDRRGRVALWAQLVVVLGYTGVLGFVLPMLWLDPFGALLKNLPILMAILVNAVLTDQR